MMQACKQHGNCRQHVNGLWHLILPACEPAAKTRRFRKICALSPQSHQVMWLAALRSAALQPWWLHTRSPSRDGGERLGPRPGLGLGLGPGGSDPQWGASRGFWAVATGIREAGVGNWMGGFEQRHLKITPFFSFSYRSERILNHFEFLVIYLFIWRIKKPKHKKKSLWIRAECFLTS